MPDRSPSPPPVIVAVVVAYRPDLQRLQQQFQALLPQVHGVVVVDNGSGIAWAPWMAQWPSPAMHLIALGRNLGIAHAQNAGVAHARTLAATHVLLMDHDSVPALDMVATLMSALSVLPGAAAVGPWYADARTHRPTRPFVALEGLRMKRLGCANPDQVFEVDHLIASGCLIPLPVLDDVGPMREDFFIDFVDVEWCLRARHKGYTVHGVCAAHLDHQLGDDPVRFLGREFMRHAPSRHYFHVRNAIRIYRLPWVPLAWKLVSAWRLLLKCGFHAVVTPPRWQYGWQMLRGLKDGWKN